MKFPSLSLPGVEVLVAGRAEQVGGVVTNGGQARGINLAGCRQVNWDPATTNPPTRTSDTSTQVESSPFTK